MIKYEKVPTYIQSRYVSWKGAALYGRKQWLDRAKRAEGYYYHDVEGTGTTFTQAQKDNITSQTNIPVSVNYLHPIANQKLALLTQTKPSMRTVSLDGRAKMHAAVLDKMKHGVLYTSNANVENELCIKDMLIAGIGHLMVMPTTFYEDGLFGLRLSHVPYDEVILDINSKKRTTEDMEGFFLEREFTLSKVYQMYGQLLAEVRDEVGNPVDVRTFTNSVWIESEKTDVQTVVTTNWNMNDRVTVREFYEKVYTTMYTVRDSATGNTNFLFAENLGEDAAIILAGAEDQRQGIFIKRSLMFGDFLLWEELLPISEYPLVTMFFEWGGKPYRSYGMMHFTIDMQEASDKLLQIMILNGILTNNAGWSAPKGSIAEEDRKKWEDYANNPRIVKEFVPVVRENQVLKPEKDQVGQLSNFYPLMLQMMKQGIEYSSGITAVLQGNAQEAGVEVFSSLQQYQNAAMMRVILSTSHINEAMKQLGTILTEYLVAKIEPDTYFFFDEKGQLNELALAQDIVNDFKKYKYLVVSIPSTAMPTQRLAIGSELMKIAQSSPDPAERSILTQKALELSDIKEYDEIKEQIDAVRNAEGKLNQMEEAYNRLLETSKQMENKFINISIENRILKQMSNAEADIAATAAQTTTELKLATQLAQAKIEGKQRTQTE